MPRPGNPGLVGRCGSGEAALTRLGGDGSGGGRAVDLAFLDIEMPGLSGVGVARTLEAGPMVIFATAHADFAVEAFAADAVDYLLKPFVRERVLAAVDRATVQRSFRLGGRAVVAPRRTLPVKDGGRTNLVPVRDILWAEAAGDYALLHTQNGTYTARVTLRELEGELERSGFLRVQRSAIVRAACVAAVTPLAKGEAMLTLTDGAQVKATRTHRDAISALAAGS